MIRSPEVGESQLEVLRGRDPLWLLGFSDRRKLCEIKGLPLGIDFWEVILR